MGNGLAEVFEKAKSEVAIHFAANGGRDSLDLAGDGHFDVVHCRDAGEVFGYATKFEARVGRGARV
jgi:hypothetical protein